MADKKDGIIVHDSDRAWSGYTLFAESVEDPEAVADGRGKIRLVDMDGSIVHEWYAETALQSHCRLLPSGNVIYPTRDRSMVTRAGLRELDDDSETVWYYHCWVDHDFQILGDGNLLIHTITDYPWPELGPGLKRHPRILEVTREQEVLWQWRGEEHLAELEALLEPEHWSSLQERARGKFRFDWAHNNTCQVIPPNEAAEKEAAAGDPVRFKPGNIVFSYRSLDIIGVIDRPSGEIVWAWGPGVIDGQHKPHMLPSGRILVFDNGTLRGYSRVIEVDPLTGDIEWEYTSKPKEDFLSRYISGAQRLPNGNTLICSGGQTRLFEVTPEGDVVWDFSYPWHEEGALNSIYRCKRYSEEHCRGLLDRLGK